MIHTIDAASTGEKVETTDEPLSLSRPARSNMWFAKTPKSQKVDAKEVRTALRDVIDPELGLNIIDLGLVYDIEVDGDVANIHMTLTSPGCPMGPHILSETKAAAETVDGVNHAEIILVWEPYWTEDRIDSRVRALMGY